MAPRKKQDPIAFPNSGLSVAKWLEVDQETVEGMIRSAAAKLTKNVPLRSMDFEDVCQEFRLAVWRGVNAFDPSKSAWLSFVATIIQRHRLRLLERHFAKCRDPRRTVSIETLCAPNSCDELSGVEIDLEGRVFTNNTSPAVSRTHYKNDLAADLNSLLEHIGPRSRELLEMSTTHSARCIATFRSTARTTIQYQLKQVKKRLQISGLRHYLNFQPFDSSSKSNT